MINFICRAPFIQEMMLKVLHNINNINNMCGCMFLQFTVIH